MLSMSMCPCIKIISQHNCFCEMALNYSSLLDPPTINKRRHAWVQDASIMLAFGRRYGLVGRNGALTSFKEGGCVHCTLPSGEHSSNAQQ